MSVCVGSAWKNLPGTARSLSVVTNKARQGRADSNVLEEFLDLSDMQGRARRANIFNYWPLSSWSLSSSSANSKQGRAGRQGRATRQKDLGNFRIWFSRHGFQDLGSQLWGLDFHTRGFQDRNLKTFKT